MVAITGDAGVSDLEDDDGNVVEPECGANLNKEDPARPFQLRVWKPGTGDAFAAEPAITFDPVKDSDGNLAKLEAIAADPARPGAFLSFTTAATRCGIWTASSCQ